MSVDKAKAEAFFNYYIIGRTVSLKKGEKSELKNAGAQAVEIHEEPRGRVVELK